MLPADVKENATLRGQEYAWSPDTFIEILHRTARHGLACAEGQFQFRIADEPTCEMYWMDIDTGGRNSSESWTDFQIPKPRIVFSSRC